MYGESGFQVYLLLFETWTMSFFYFFGRCTTSSWCVYKVTTRSELKYSKHVHYRLTAEANSKDAVVIENAVYVRLLIQIPKMPVTSNSPGGVGVSRLSVRVRHNAWIWLQSGVNVITGLYLTLCPIVRLTFWVINETLNYNYCGWINNECISNYSLLRGCMEVCQIVYGFIHLINDNINVFSQIWTWLELHIDTDFLQSRKRGLYSRICWPRWVNT